MLCDLAVVLGTASFTTDGKAKMKFTVNCHSPYKEIRNLINKGSCGKEYPSPAPPRQKGLVLFHNKTLAKRIQHFYLTPFNMEFQH